MNRADLERAIAAERAIMKAKAERYEREMEAHRATLSWLEAGVSLLAGEADVSAHVESTPLTSDIDSTTIEAVSSPTVSSAELSRGMAKSKSKRHPFVRELYDRKRVTVSQWAKEHGVPVASVSSWVSKGPGARRIPMRWAKVIQEELGLPATLATWKNGITE